MLIKEYKIIINRPITKRLQSSKEEVQKVKLLTNFRHFPFLIKQHNRHSIICFFISTFVDNLSIMKLKKTTYTKFSRQIYWNINFLQITFCDKFLKCISLSMLALFWVCSHFEITIKLSISRLYTQTPALIVRWNSLWMPSFCALSSKTRKKRYKYLIRHRTIHKC